VLILVIILCPLFLTVFLLSIPVDLAFFFERGEVTRSRLRIGWLFGLIGKDLGGVKSGQEKKPEEMKAKKGRGSIRWPMAAFRARGFFGNILRFANRLVRSVEVRDVDVELHIGTGDPAETGLLFAVIGPSLAVASGSSHKIRIEPNFVEETFEGHARGTVRVYPIRLIPPLIAFALSPATFRGIKALKMAR
jgi:hypothetical protein